MTIHLNLNLIFNNSTPRRLTIDIKLYDYVEGFLNGNYVRIDSFGTD